MPKRLGITAACKSLDAWITPEAEQEKLEIKEARNFQLGFSFALSVSNIGGCEGATIGPRQHVSRINLSS